MKKNVSEKQLAANRRNARKSTGPRSADGRAVSSMNALKHGILSRQVLVRSQSLRESGQELAALLRRVWEELKPEGAVEEMLVDQIVTAHWRLRRALKAESGEIALSVDRTSRQHNHGANPVLQWIQWRAFGDPIPAMEQSLRGLNVLQFYLSEFRARVEAENGLTEQAIHDLQKRFGSAPSQLMGELDALRKKLEAETQGSEAGHSERRREAALDFIDRKLAEWFRLAQFRGEDEDWDGAAKEAAAVLPSAEVLEKIQRYETKLERQMFRAMAQLERLQRMRRGEAVPAPLSAFVSVRE